MSPTETEQLARKLLQQLCGSDASVRVQAAIRLSEMGTGARLVLHDLIALLGHHDPAVRKVVAWVLGYVGVDNDEAVRALDRALGDSDAAVRRAARSALAVTHLGRAA
jgi:HEAT repeat protein